MADISQIKLPNGTTYDIKAIKDGNGNIITNTYLPLSGGVVSGDITADGINTGSLIVRGSSRFVGDTFATTQTQGDNSTKVATTEYVDKAVQASPSGTVKSVGLTMPTGLTVSNSPITSTGNINVTYTSGYSIPTNAKQSEWDDKLSLGGGTLRGVLNTKDVNVDGNIKAKNLPFTVEYGTPVTLINNQIVAVSKDGDNDWFASAENPFTIPFDFNALYKVTFDGTEYDLFYESHEQTSSGGGYYEWQAIGNTLFLGCANNNGVLTVPFCIAQDYHRNAGEIQLFTTDTTKTSHTITIKKVPLTINLPDLNLLKWGNNVTPLIRPGSSAHSTIIGNGADASGEGSFAIGMNARALNNSAVAIGATIATGKGSFATGIGIAGITTEAKGDYSIAMGTGAVANGGTSTAIGQLTKTTDTALMSSAFGDRTIASGRAQFVHGMFNIEDTNPIDTSHGNNARKYLHIVGNGTSESARSNAYTLDWSGNGWYAGSVTATNGFLGNATTSSVPLGFASRQSTATWGVQTGNVLTDWHTTSGGDIAFRDNCPSAGQLSVVIDGNFYQDEGRYKVKDESNTFNVTRGSSVNTSNSGYWSAMCISGTTGALPTANKWWHIISTDWNGGTTNWNSQLAFATQDGDGVWWRRNDAGGTDIGVSTWHRLAEGDANGYANRALADGSGNSISGTYMTKVKPTGTGSLSLNRKAGTTVGTNSVAVGNNTAATGIASHAEGDGTTAGGNVSHAEGYNTKAIGAYSHTEGDNTTANGMFSHAENQATTANGKASHAEGYFTTASGEYQHAQGKFNIADTANKYVDIVGNGTADNARSNAYTLDWNGNAWFAGGIHTNGVKNGQRTGVNYLDGKTRLKFIHDGDVGYNISEIRNKDSGFLISGTSYRKIYRNDGNFAEIMSLKTGRWLTREYSSRYGYEYSLTIASSDADYAIFDLMWSYIDLPNELCEVQYDDASGATHSIQFDTHKYPALGDIFYASRKAGNTFYFKFRSSSGVPTESKLFLYSLETRPLHDKRVNSIETSDSKMYVKAHDFDFTSATNAYASVQGNIWMHGRNEAVIMGNDATLELKSAYAQLYGHDIKLISYANHISIGDVIDADLSNVRGIIHSTAKISTRDKIILSACSDYGSKEKTLKVSIGNDNVVIGKLKEREYTQYVNQLGDTLSSDIDVGLKIGDNDKIKVIGATLDMDYHWIENVTAIESGINQDLVLTADRSPNYDKSGIKLEASATFRVADYAALSNGALCIYGLQNNSYNEGIRIGKSLASGWSTIALGCTSINEGTVDGQWLIGRRGAAGAKSGAVGDLTIEHNGSTGTGLTLYKNGNNPTWNGKTLLDVTGGTLTGSLTFANGTWNVVGDDAAIGDHNKAGSLGVKGMNAMPTVTFVAPDNTQLASVGSSASGSLETNATQFVIANKVILKYNSTNECLDFVFV
ncbi:MAG: hypothetical protein KBT03_06550 [Bacteroidales bacterium]|nr:hypothetical protein [Candidatus Scybalousia scybalohippi]